MAYNNSNNKSSISLTSSNSLPSPLLTILFTALLCLLGFLYLHPTTTTAATSTATATFHRLFTSSATNSTLSSYLHSLTLHPHLAGTPQSLQPLHFLHSHFSSPPSASPPAPSPSPPSSPSPPTPPSPSPSPPPPPPPPLRLPLPLPPPPLPRLLPLRRRLRRGRLRQLRPPRRLPSPLRRRRQCERPRGRGPAWGGGAGGGGGGGGAEWVAAVLMYTEWGGFSSGVERGTVMKGAGDPLTPGWGAEEAGESLAAAAGEVLGRFPVIPSMPISAENAEAILRSLEGPAAPPEWRWKVGGLGAGPTMVNFSYQGENKVAKIHNIFAEIRGREEPDRYVLLGNHRDAWTYGAVDPNSGTAALLDIARRYALLMSKGWAPRRTIILCSWDAEEFGMIGSTEWVEQNLAILGSKAVAYLNVDCAVQGPGLFASATPQLDDLIVEVTKEIKDPDSEGMNVYQSWTAANKGINIQRLGRLDSDFAPFLQHAGVPSLDLYYGEDYPVYHTAFDSYDWMIKYGDPQFHRHVAMAGMWGLLALRLADDPILPFNYSSYAAQLQVHTDVLGKLLDSSVSIHPLVKSIEKFASAAKLVEEEIKKLKEVTNDNLLELKRRSLNDRLMLAERAFTDADDLWTSRRSQSKLSFFPGIADAITRASGMVRTEGQTAVQHEVWRVARAIQRAANVLRGELF
ncbi:hypothetical protein Syun_002358 [Stephania yunnanensis]|uniref:glutamate carboxypeptidase II n=1 Tax=Stephania yunnanensis TaxID=152371 RepID=A0AAP0LFB4_9MAGN